jgi:hypothetical protein
MDINYQFLLEIDVTPSGGSRTYKPLMAGIDNLTPALNEVLVQTSYLKDQGWGSTEVTGGQITVNLTGHRIVGDEAQDYIFSSDVLFAFGAARKTTLRLTEPGGRQIIWPVTLANLTPGGGAANNGSAITINIHGNGAPEVIEGGEVIGQLTVVSLAGTLSGDTAVYVNPSLTAGNSYVYKTAASVDIPAYDADLSSWTAWDGAADITATTGNQIVIAEIDGTNLAKKAGKATVTAKA